MKTFDLKRKFALILALALGVTGCGNNAENKNADSGEKETTSSEKADDLTTSDSGDIPTLTYFNIGEEPVNHQEVVDATNEYLDSLDAGYHINTVFYDWGDYQQKLQLAVNSGEDWDLAFTSSWAGPYKTLADQNAFLDLTDYLDNELKGAKELIDDRMIEGTKINGPLYALPAAYPGVVAANQFVWNKEYVEKYDIPYQDIQNTTQLEEYLKEVKDNEDQVEYPFNVASDFLLARENPAFEVEKGIGVKEENGKLIAYNLYKDPDFKAEIDQMKKLYDDGLINPDAPQIQADEAKGAYEASLVGEYEGEPGSEAIWSTEEEPKVASIIGESIIVDNEKATGKLVGINSQSEYKDQALDFVERMFTDKKLQDLLSYGIEGVDYELKDGKVKKLGTKDEVYDVASFQYLSMFNRTPMADGVGIGDPEFDEEVKEFEDKLVASPTLGFRVDKTNIQGELENVQATIERYYNNLKTGAFDDAYYQEFLDQLDTAGIDKAIEEIQNQLDTFSSENN
ncbi:Maltose-binding periplasmic proteins/domains [Anaerococcus octavius]|uniref:Maltose-binding periplasmic proteins/domains n=1 Tax=Anaerococcus octavius TaxID=54007 RepID=A0A380WWI9_9FIRM|nr:ABC transporter substrate-binding protein [Anaerococcus octavius]SUU93438.1 Maltose-binding periplasmic proteins/domains [Anaerococcus octavius]